MSISVLYVHPIGTFGGASRSLLELVEGFPAGTVTPHLITQRGSVVPVFEGQGIDIIQAAGISQFDHTRFGHYRGKRWLLLLRELYYLPFTLFALLRARWRWRDIDVVHVNEFVALTSIVISKALFHCPVVVHVRSVQHVADGSLRRRFVLWILKRWTDAVIAIDETVRCSLPAEVPCEVIHNSYTLRTGDAEISRQEFRERPLRAGGARLRVAMVGNLLPLKGVREMIDAVLLCRSKGFAVEFIVVGGNTRNLSGITGWLVKRTQFASDLEAEIDSFVQAHGLSDIVRRVGFTLNIDEIYRNIDVLCFPSHLDAVGRPVYEAAFWKVPSIVAVRDPRPDTVIHGETSLCIEPGNSRAIADAVEYFWRNPGEIDRMGEAAHKLAMQNFDSRTNAKHVLEVYRRVLGPAAATQQAI